jgi:GT2 family glycosyltransferase
MVLKIDGMRGLVAWIFLAQDSKELGDFVNKLLKYSQNLSYSQTFGFRIRNSGNLLHS